MTEPDYFTVMERSISYYAQKYDPENRLERYRILPPGENPDKVQVLPAMEKPPVRKAKKKFIAFFSF